MKTALEIFEFLPGIWQVRKNITSSIPTDTITGEGFGVFQQAEDNPSVILYSEKVTIKSTGDGSTTQGAQKYQYRYDPNTVSISKYFSDGKFFYTLYITDNKIGGEHLCGQDNYLSSYIFEDNKFTIIYSVQGPYKCYDIITEYTKLPAEEIDTGRIILETRIMD